MCVCVDGYNLGPNDNKLFIPLRGFQDLEFGAGVHNFQWGPHIWHSLIVTVERP